MLVSMATRMTSCINGSGARGCFRLEDNPLAAVLIQQ